MNHRESHHRSVTAYVQDVEVTCTGVVFYPSQPATEIDPPEPPMVEWDQVLIGGVDVGSLFHGDLGYQLQDALVEQLEEA